VAGITFTVDTSEISKMSKALAVMMGQHEWITARAMTTAAKASKERIRAEVFPMIKGGPTAWTRRGLIASYASPKNLTSQVGFQYGECRYTDDAFTRKAGGVTSGRYMGINARGGDRRPKSTELAVRRAGVKLPVLVLTARGALPERIRGLDGGADDYVIKPVDLHELAARLRSLVRRSHGEPQERVVAQNITLDPAAHCVEQGGVAVALSPREFDLLHALMLNAGRVLSREQLEQHLYSWGQEVDSNAIEVHIHHLRRKLGATSIQTVRGLGYLLLREASTP
jgi:two-component system OmpR family response regulator/two-component system response regulator QseB